MAAKLLETFRKSLCEKGSDACFLGDLNVLSSLLDYLVSIPFAHANNLNSRIYADTHTQTSPEYPSQAQLGCFQKVLSHSMVPLYKAHPASALHLSSAIFVELFKSSISPLLKAKQSEENRNNLNVWETLLRSLADGIQVYIPLARLRMTSQLQYSATDIHRRRKCRLVCLRITFKSYSINHCPCCLV